MFINFSKAFLIFIEMCGGKNRYLLRTDGRTQTRKNKGMMYYLFSKKKVILIKLVMKAIHPDIFL